MCIVNIRLAEVVQIQFDPNIISHTEILNVFFAAHNSTTLNKQGADKGTQYRSVIFTLYSLAKQVRIAHAPILKISADWELSIVTQVTSINHYTLAKISAKNTLLEILIKAIVKWLLPTKISQNKYLPSNLLENK